MATLYCITVLWNLWEVLCQSARLCTGCLTSRLCRQQTNRCSSHPVKKIQADSYLSDDKDRWECWQPQVMLLNHFNIHPVAVLECEPLHSCMFSMSQFKAYRCAVHSCLHIWTEELQTYRYFYYSRQGAGGLQQNSQTWVWQTDGHGLTAAHLALHPLSTVHKPATLPSNFLPLF